MVSNKQAFVSVIIPTYHDWGRLKLCLNSLSLQTYPRENFEIIIVNNDPDDAPQYIALPLNSKLISEAKPGSYAARNTGIKAATGSIFAFTDSDCIPDRNWINNGIKKLISNNEISFIGGNVVLMSKNKKLTLSELYEKAFTLRNDLIIYGRKHAVTANLFAYKYAFNETGLFDERLMSGGDVDWCQRAAKNGFIIGFSDSSMVYHPARTSLVDLLKKHLRVIGGQFLNDNKISKRLMVVIVGFLPPFTGFIKLRVKTDLSAKDKLKAISLLYVMRLIRSISYIMMSVNIFKPRRA